MKYPYRVVIEDMSIIDKGPSVFVSDEVGPHDYGASYDHYETQNAEELLVFLMGVYNWHPNIDCPGCGLNLNVVPPS